MKNNAEFVMIFYCPRVEDLAEAHLKKIFLHLYGIIYYYILIQGRAGARNQGAPYQRAQP